MKLKIISLFFVFLMISSSFAYADLSGSVESGAEKTGKALSTFEATDIIINVDSYYPTVLQEQAFESDQPGGYAMFATLTGIKTNPIMDLQKIDSIDVKPTGSTTKYVSSINYKKPQSGYFDLNNLGYLVIRLRNLKEDEVPKRLDINMTANIIFEIQNGFGVNENDLILPVLTEEEFLNRKNEFSFYGGRGYVRLANIRGDTADLIVYDGRLNKNSVSVKEGIPSTKQYLGGGVSYLFSDENDIIGRNFRNYYKIKVNEITGNKDRAKIEMLFNGEYKLKEFSEGQYLYPESKWKVNAVKITDDYDELELINEDTKEKLVLKGGKFYVPPKKAEVSKGGSTVDSTDYGLMQINDKYWKNTFEQNKDFNWEKIKIDPEENIRAAAYIYSTTKDTTNGGFNQWSAYKNNNYKNFLNKNSKYDNLFITYFEDQADIARAIMWAESSEGPNKINFNYINGGNEVPKEDESLKLLTSEYQSLKDELNDLISNKKSDFSQIKPTLDKYKTFLDKVKSKSDSKLFNNYKTLILNDILNLEKAYRPISINEKNLIDIDNNIVDFIESLNLEEKQVEQVKQETTEGTSDYYFEKAIENYKTVVDHYSGAVYENKNVAMDAQLKIAQIYDYNLKQDDKAVEEYRKLISLFDYPEKDVIQQRIDFLEKNSLHYNSDTLNIFEGGNSIQLTLYSSEKAEAGSKARINVNGVSNIYSLEKDKFNLGNTGWYLKEINKDNVLIAKINKEGKENIETLRLNDKGKPVDENTFFILEDVELNQEVHITILPGEERLTTQTDFMLHIPVEPRLWKLTPEQINEHINATKKIINFLNNGINVIENIYKVWSIGCYSTFAILLAKNVWFGTASRGLARGTVMSSWKEECENAENNKIYGGDAFECIKNKKEEINSDLDKAQELIKQNENNYNERIKTLAKYNFNAKGLNTKYDNEVIQILIDESVSEKLKDKTNPTVEDIGKATVESYHEIFKDKDNLINTYHIVDSNYFNSINLDKDTSEISTGLEKISKSQIFKVNEQDYIFVGNKPYKISKDEKNKDYYILNDKRHYFEGVDKSESTPESQKAITLINSGKWKGKIDKLSIDSVNYLRVSRRGSDGIPLEVELWERYSQFGSVDLRLDTENARRVSGPFSLEDCKAGKTSQREGVDIFESLRLQYLRLQEACNDIISMDRLSDLGNKKPGENVRDYLVQYAAQETGGLQCFDIMEIDDCLTLFSVCDPVMCPVSRFTAGGKWKVDNVVSTGIFGSIFLGTGLWDFSRVPPEVGICVPGVDAGLKNYRSIIEGYQECLIVRKDKGENVGICDTIRNIGICKILWKEGTSFVRLTGGALDSLLSVIKKTDGGGEYAYFQTNMQKTGDFLSFFTKEYATTYFSAYRGASTDEIGEELCKAAIYGKIPGKGDLLDQLTKPEGPAQFIGWFTEVPQSDVGGSLKSDYEVYYHIYAGEDREQVRYYVYLKDLDDLSRRNYITKTTGYLNRGDFVDETVRVQDDTGYDELCIVIDNQENCGFGKVSSDLALAYFEDKSLDKDIKGGIKNEQECIGESNALSNPGVGSVIDAFYPNLLENGLVRVCSKENPGKGVDESAWKDIGTCDKNSLGQELGRCWLSKQSYKDALSKYDTEAKNKAEELFETIGKNLLSDEEINNQIISLINSRNFAKTLEEDAAKIQFKYFIEQFENLNGKTINLDLNAKINFEIGETYYELAVYLNKEEIQKNPTSPTTISGETEKTEEIGEETYCEIEYSGKNLIRMILSINPYFRFNKDEGYWEYKALDFNMRSTYKRIQASAAPLFNRLSHYLISFEGGLNVIVNTAKEKDDRLIIHYKGNENILEGNSLTVDNVIKSCNLEKLSVKEVQEQESNEYFLKIGGGFDVFFDKDSFSINEKTKNEIRLYIESNYNFIKKSEDLEIVSFYYDDKSKELSKKRLNAILEILQSKPYNLYTKDLKIKSESLNYYDSNYLFIQTDRSLLDKVVKIRFIGKNKEQSLFRANNYKSCEFEYDDKNILFNNYFFKFDLVNNRWVLDHYQFSFRKFLDRYSFKKFLEDNYSYEKGIKRLLQFANLRKHRIIVSKYGNSVFFYEGGSIDPALTNILYMCN